jgi:hypothetical protein
MATTSTVIRTDSEPFVGHFFAQPGEKMTYKRREVPCCRRLAVQRPNDQRRDQAFDQPAEQKQWDQHEQPDLGELRQ